VAVRPFDSDAQGGEDMSFRFILGFIIGVALGASFALAFGHEPESALHGKPLEGTPAPSDAGII
jgi:hypothetical protein